MDKCNYAKTVYFWLFLMRRTIFAGIVTIIDIILLYLLSEFLYIWCMYSVIIVCTVITIVNYLLNKYLSFKNRNKRIISQFGLHTTAVLVGLGLNQLVLYSLVEFVGLWYVYAKLIAVSTITFWSFYGYKKLTFNIIR